MLDTVLCFIPCSSEMARNGSPPVVEADLRQRWQYPVPPCLRAGRELMKGCVDRESPAVPALDLYTGPLYAELEKDEIRRRIRDGNLRIFIISNGYGIVDAEEPICPHTGVMNGPAALTWKARELDTAISRVCRDLQPKSVFGFFTGEPRWPGAEAKHRYFFTEGMRKAIRQGMEPARAGCFYRAQGNGAPAVLSSLGAICMDFVREGFPDSILSAAQNGGIRKSEYPDILIRYQPFV